MTAADLQDFAARSSFTISYFLNVHTVQHKVIVFITMKTVALRSDW